jgi:hypothetical protein
MGLGTQTRLNDLEKYRLRADDPFAGSSQYIGKTVGAVPREPDTFVANTRRTYGKDFQAAMRFAKAADDVEFRPDRLDANGITGTLFYIRSRHNAKYDDVEDGFTEDRTNFDSGTVTLQSLARQVKSLKRDLKRAGLI